MAERIAYDEFAYFHENASEYGIAYSGPPEVRRVSVAVAAGRSLSALVWGTEAPRYVFLHGGAQNAHTWDTVALALGEPLIAIDLPGHGHSDGPADGAATWPPDLARDVAVVVRALAPAAECVVGMSLGGLTALALAGLAPELVRRLVLVDITPGVTGAKSHAIAAFVNGPQSFPSFEELLARTIEHNPTRTESSLRRGILHNAVQLEDGSWMWRYRRHAGGLVESPAAAGPAGGAPEAGADAPRYGALWDTLEALRAPVLLVRGMRTQSVVDDADEAEFLARAWAPTVARVEEAGHSVQGDTPVELAELVRQFVTDEPGAGQAIT